MVALAVHLTANLHWLAGTRLGKLYTEVTSQMLTINRLLILWLIIGSLPAQSKRNLNYQEVKLMELVEK